MTRRIFAIASTVLMLAACQTATPTSPASPTLEIAGSDPAAPVEAPATVTDSIAERLEPATGASDKEVPDPSQTPTTATAERAAGPTDMPTTAAPYESCAWVWHSEPLPDHTAEVTAAFEAAGFTVVAAQASAFGENCVTAEGEVNRFAIMETDYDIDLSVGDPAALERTAAEAVTLLANEFPPDTTPGPISGQVRLDAASGSESISLWFTLDTAINALSEGLTDLALLEALGYTPGGS